MSFNHRQQGASTVLPTQHSQRLARLSIVICKRRLIFGREINGIIIDNANARKHHHLNVIVFVLTHSDSPCEALNRP
jgi:hypothetical protein